MISKVKGYAYFPQVVLPSTSKIRDDYQSEIQLHEVVVEESHAS